MSVIDASFIGIPNAIQVHQLGRPELTDRPGDILVALVSQFSSDGGFARLAANRAPAPARPEPASTRHDVDMDRRITRWFETDLDDDLDLQA